MKKPNVLIISDAEDTKFFDSATFQGDQWRLSWKTINYNRLFKETPEIRKLILEKDIDFVMYSRNDQVGKKVRIGPFTKELQIGYSSFSGIDEVSRINQMKKCFQDFMDCNQFIDFGDYKKSNSYPKYSKGTGTFSLVFDVEQLGCVRYGLPRILQLLDKYGIHATFFVTNLMQKIYPNVVKSILSLGHEIGIHGQWHEYLSKYDSESQEKLIRKMIEDFPCPVYGANFVGRMNNNTLNALVENGVKYFVYPMINYYTFFCYPKMPTESVSILLEKGKILMNPLCVETYSHPWISIKGMVDSASSQRFGKNNHLTILLHPFRDGNVQHINITEQLLKYLIQKKKLVGILAKEIKSNEGTTIDYSNINDSAYLGLSKRIPLNGADFFYTIPELFLMFYNGIRKNNANW